MCWVVSLGTGKAPLSGSVKSSSSESVELTAGGRKESSREEVKIVWRQEEEEWGERGATVEVGAWKHVPAVRDTNCLVQLG